jgi:hypothetical protein
MVAGMNENILNSKAVFDSYWEEVRKVLNLPAREPPRFIKADAIRLLRIDWKTLDGNVVVDRLFKSLNQEFDGWKETPGKNWIWRHEHTKPSPKNRSQEVLLEHEIIALGGQCWTRQISTASGVDKKADGMRTRANRRRSIDLVFDQGNGGFSFIELKVGSDSPIYALFEILGYGLAYWHSWQEKLDHPGDASRLMQAKKIDLVVLGPESWYRNNPPDLATLVKQLNQGLAVQTQNKPPMRLFYTKYPLDDFKNAVVAADTAIIAVTLLAQRHNEFPDES